MRLRLSEILSSFDYYNRIGEFRNQDILDIVVDFDIPSGMKLKMHDGVVDIIKEVLDFTGTLHIPTKNPQPLRECNYVKSFDQYIIEVYQKLPPQDPDYDNRPQGWNEDDPEEE